VSSIVCILFPTDILQSNYPLPNDAFETLIACGILSPRSRYSHCSTPAQACFDTLLSPFLSAHLSLYTTRWLPQIKLYFRTLLSPDRFSRKTLDPNCQTRHLRSSLNSTVQVKPRTLGPSQACKPSPSCMKTNTQRTPKSTYLAATLIRFSPLKPLVETHNIASARVYTVKIILIRSPELQAHQKIPSRSSIHRAIARCLIRPWPQKHVQTLSFVADIVKPTPLKKILSTPLDHEFRRRDALQSQQP
jgi:hypothetical protein